MIYKERSVRHVTSEARTAKMFLSLLIVAITSADVLAGTQRRAAHSDAITTVFTFANGTFLENIHTRSNGELLLTSIALPTVFIVDPRAATPAPHALVTINSTTVTGITGITEYARDQYAVLASLQNPSNFSATNLSVWTFDAHNPRPRKVADLPDVGIGNGLISLPHAPGNVLLSDSDFGALWRVNVHTGAVDRVFQDDALAPAASGLVKLGVNGIRLGPRLGPTGYELYFANSNRQTVGKVPIHADGSAAGNVTVLATNTDYLFDDFAVDRHGRLWVAAHPNAIDLVLPDGEQVLVTGFNLTSALDSILGVTSAAFGLGSSKAESTLFVTSGDGVLFALDTRCVEL